MSSGDRDNRLHIHKLTDAFRAGLPGRSVLYQLAVPNETGISCSNRDRSPPLHLAPLERPTFAALAMAFQREAADAIAELGEANAESGG